MGVLYRGLGISKLKFLIKKIKNKISSCKSFSIVGHQTLDPDPGSGSAIRKNAGSGSGLNQCGSATLQNLHVDIIEGERVQLVGGVEELPGRNQIAHTVLAT